MGRGSALGDKTDHAPCWTDTFCVVYCIKVGESVIIMTIVWLINKLFLTIDIETFTRCIGCILGA